MNDQSQTGLEQMYRRHHAGRGDDFGILLRERGDFLRKHVGQGKTVLDIGCRDGELTATYAQGNKVTGADIDRVALARAEEKLGIMVKHMDLNAEWDVPEHSYDVVVACEVLEHLYYPPVVLEKIARVLTPHGVLVGTVPHAYSLQSRIKFLLGIQRGTPLEDPTHINHFTAKGFRALLGQHFDVLAFEGIVPARYRALSYTAPYLFAHDLLFAARARGMS